MGASRSNATAFHDSDDELIDDIRKAKSETQGFGWSLLLCYYIYMLGEDYGPGLCHPSSSHLLQISIYQSHPWSSDDSSPPHQIMWIRVSHLPLASFDLSDVLHAAWPDALAWRPWPLSPDALRHWVEWPHQLALPSSVMLDYRHQKQHAIRTKLIAISDSHIITKAPFG
jgi:hypothetical protein